MNRIIDEHGNFTLDNVTNLDDAQEALHECYRLIKGMQGQYECPACKSSETALVSKIPRLIKIDTVDYLQEITVHVCGNCERPFHRIGSCVECPQT